MSKPQSTEPAVSTLHSVRHVRRHSSHEAAALDAPILANRPDENPTVLETSAIPYDGAVIRIPTYAGMETGDIIELEWQGRISYRAQWPVALPDRFLDFRIPKAVLLAEVGGDDLCLVSYKVTRRNRKIETSLVLQVFVVAYVTPLAPPVIPEATNGEIDFSAVSLPPGLRVEFPAAGPILMAQWLSFGRDGRTMNEERFGVSPGETVYMWQSALELTEPGGEVRILYMGVSDGYLTESTRAVLRAVRELFSPYVEASTDEVLGRLDPSLAQVHAVAPVPAGGRWQALDKVTFTWTGSTSGAYSVSLRVPAGGESSPVRMLVQGNEHVRPNNGGSVTLGYVVEHDDGSSNTQAQMITLAVGTLPTIDSVKDRDGAEVPDNGSTDSVGLTLVGKATARQPVEIRDKLSPLGTTDANADGDWTLELDDLPLGVHGFEAVDLFSKEVSKIHIVTGIERRPTVDLVKDRRTGEDIPNGESTTSTSVMVSGTARAGYVVEILEAGISHGAVMVGDDGCWTKDIDNLKLGVHDFLARGVHGGNPPISNIYRIRVIDVRPTIESLKDSAGDEIPDGEMTSSTSVTISGTARAGHEVEVRETSAVSFGIVLVDEGGDWTLTIDNLREKAYVLHAVGLYGGEPYSLPRAFVVIPG